MTAPQVLTEERPGVLVITINRHEARNAVNRAVSQGIADALDLLDARDDLVVGILTGAGDNFCAGMDLKAFAEGESPRLPGRGFGGLVEATPDKPLIAAVEGWALAGGCELALAADLIVASEAARFGLPEVKRGLVAAAGGLLRLPKMVPVQLAMSMALTGEPITAREAHDNGLVTLVSAPGEALTVALDLAHRIAANGPLAVRATKRIIKTAQGDSPEDWARMRRISDPVFSSADAAEGARAFVEKRRPAWVGR